MTSKHLPPLYYEYADHLQRWFAQRLPSHVPASVEVTMAQTLTRTGLTCMPHFTVRLGDNWIDSHACTADMSAWREETLQHFLAYAQ